MTVEMSLREQLTDMAMGEARAEVEAMVALTSAQRIALALIFERLADTLAEIDELEDQGEGT